MLEATAHKEALSIVNIYSTKKWRCREVGDIETH